MFSIHRNCYLQMKCATVNPRILNRSVDLAREQPCIDPHDYTPPFNRLCSEQPCAPLGGIDITRRPVGFGRWALPKLRRELHSKDPLVVIQAVTSITDLVHDPEKGYEAIRLKIPDRLADLLVNESDQVREQTALALTVLAGLYDGKNAIVQNEMILDGLKTGLDDEEIAVRHKIAACIEMTARVWMSADVLVEFGFVQSLLDKIRVIDEELPEIVAVHLETLKSLLYCDGRKIAFDSGGYEIFVQLLEHEDFKIIENSLDCLMRLTLAAKGKKLAIKTKLLEKLNDLLYHEKIEVNTSAASVIMNCTIKMKAKVMATRIKHLPQRLIQLCENPLNGSLQMFCMKALTNICEHPKVRKEVVDNYLEILEGQQVRYEPKFKEILMSVVNWMPS